MNEDELDRMYGVRRMPAGRALLIIISASISLWLLIIGAAWSLI